MALTFLIGGARSGKSSLAVRLATTHGADAVFVATAEAKDEEMAERIARHRTERPAGWHTVESPRALGAAVAAADPSRTLVIDCLSFWVANLVMDDETDASIEAEAAAAAVAAANRPGPTIAVSNEVGMGVVPDAPMGRRFRDVLGRVNASWAAHADDAYLVIAGRALALDRIVPEEGGDR
jgi:adenosylcobinamide kinase/adenosylcobinamide-phosphate guanylyltransferase